MCGLLHPRKEVSNTQKRKDFVISVWENLDHLQLQILEQPDEWRAVSKLSRRTHIEKKVCRDSAL